MELLTEIDSRMKIIETLICKYEKSNRIEALITALAILIIGVIIGYTIIKKDKNHKTKTKNKYTKWIYVESIFLAIIAIGAAIYLRNSTYNKKNVIENNIKEVLQIISQDENCSVMLIEKNRSSKWAYESKVLNITFTYNNSERPITYTVYSLPSDIGDNIVEYGQALNNRKIVNSNSLTNNAE